MATGLPAEAVLFSKDLPDATAHGPSFRMTVESVLLLIRRGGPAI